ncbi:FKBP-type peptidyl-prolyl cis-trans isomerase [Thiohalobacter sp. IOR34]|uniref:FKBP-type peptidyl-prolyl cis-trans isomerase n=1 Tax=Thiohalobacter sp. IOR34 TaxID=3057176 RepID=UPI0025AF79A3|nr:FKBP-type peptidyl-prolyl cis-trans isomerase [Thiohalobacter sp. IOR34]WJW76099.1 FKBP-type peptidyl-prolyl cis-trans isomerase [Thiohalobacter sp. IOR34]
MTEFPLHFVGNISTQSVVRDKVVRLKYALFEQGSERVLAYRDDLWYLHGGYGGAFPKIEQALEGYGVGARLEVTLSPEEGYGEQDPALVISLPLEAVPPEARHVGARLDGEAPDGRVLSFTVTAVEGERLTVDGNHPLAGKSLRFVLEILAIRDATAEELAAGYAFPDEPPASPAD